MTFDTVIMVDWSSANDQGGTPRANAIWACAARQGIADEPVYLRNRQIAEDWITNTIAAERAKGLRVMVGFDLCFAYPAGFATRLIGSEDTLALWDWFADRVVDSSAANNRFDLAGEINGMFPGVGPFWFNGLKRDIANLPRTKSGYGGFGIDEFRATDHTAAGAQSPFKLGGAGAVGGQVIMGLPTLSRLRHRFGADLSVWPFQTPDAPIVLAETYFSLLNQPLPDDPIKDAAQVRDFATRFSGLDAASWTRVLDRASDPQGWIMGLGQEDLLRAPTPPALRNDCFAMPRGAHWTPVDEALTHLRQALRPVTRTEAIPVTKARGRYLAGPAIALRAHPPHANAAVDGYGFAGEATKGVHRLPLVAGRAAAGVPFAGRVPPGHAIRVLTGAHLPRGVDTIVLQEDVTADDTVVAFHGPLKRGANARKAGEDIKAGDVILPKGRHLTPADLATMTATGIGQVNVHRRLKVGVLSTGDELAEPGSAASQAQIYDANRPMLLATLESWGYDAIDLGRAPDDRSALQAMLDAAAQETDAILTSGGASAGDEDHMSALLDQTGSAALWRVAIKPGRPLALGMWQGTPIFGLPGNPVAAQVCTLVFARPALSILAGGDWVAPQGFDLPAAFSKSKKAGRREYLRARLEDGAVAVFPSEGSGRVSGLSWADGLVELADGAAQIAPGDLVRFIPYTSFGL